MDLPTSHNPHKIRYLDAVSLLQASGVMQDDSQIDLLQLRRYGIDKKHPHVLACLQEIRSQEHAETRHD